MDNMLSELKSTMPIPRQQENVRCFLNIYCELFTLLVLLIQFSINHGVDVNGTIIENITFFYRKLPMEPSRRATIEFKIVYLQSSIKHKDRYPLMGIYTEYPKINIEKQCSHIRYGQLRNENLHPRLRFIRPRRTTSCEKSGAETVNCRGIVNIQDYIPRHFYLTFGFHCDWPPVNSLKGLKYNISFSKQKNETNNCTGYKSLKIHGKCGILYDATSLPNLIGNEEVKQIMDIDQGLRMFESFVFEDGTCYKHFLEFACHIILPTCDPETNGVMHPCREMCWDIVNGCKEKIGRLVDIISTRSDINPLNISEVIICNYLPLFNNSIPCFYKPVTCDSPSDVTNGTRILNATHKDVYQLHDVVQYACVNEMLRMVGDASVSCLYSGEWSTLPMCGVVKEVKNSVMYPVYIMVPILLVPLLITLVVIVVAKIKWKRKTLPDLNEEKIQFDNTLVKLTDNYEPLLPSKRKQDSTLSLDSLPPKIRNRNFDAFVLYHFDTDHDFVINTLIPELEEKRNFRLIIHSRDFQPGRKIEENMEEAIKSSNNAIILMSSGFTISRWCADEFSHCYIEHIDDPTFKVFIIMRQPVRHLTNLTPNMKKLFTEQTYLDIYDPDLFTKLARYLKQKDDGDVSDCD